jgi:hypothetical protein
MPEVCQQATYATALRIQRREILERNGLFQLCICLWRLRVYPALLWVQLVVKVGQASACLRLISVAGA